MYESYSLEGFSGGSLTITGSDERPGDILESLNPCCPECGRVGKVKFE
jgi:hypothetical protein